MTARRPHIQPPLRCGSYAPGHEPHWIQAKISRNEPPLGHGTASVDSDGWITVALNGKDPVRLWTHDPERLAQQLAAADHWVELRPHCVLAIKSGQGSYVVSVDTEPSACPSPHESTADLSLVELVQQRGGFALPIDDPRFNDPARRPDGEST